MRRAGTLVVCATALGGCGNLQGLGGPAPPLVTFQVQPAGDPGASTSSLQVALVWGAEWWPEPFCFLPPESSDAQAVIAAGCRDPFGFVPAQVGASVPVSLGQPASLSLDALPTADLLVGGVTSRVGYASFVLYDDRDGSGTLELSSPHRAPSGGRQGPPETDMADSADVVYGASFLTMTAPDLRVSYLEGTFQPSAFYPRQGCGDPPPRFGILGASGFSAADALAASAAGTIPTESDLNACSQAAPDATIVPVTAQDPADVAEVSCVERTNDGSTRYRQPPSDPLDLSDRVYACAHLPSFGGQTPPDLIQLVVSGHAGDHCKGLTHYTLRGCREDVACAVPDWDFTASPPTWWPCPY
jgi:hypothetical protein